MCGNMKTEIMAGNNLSWGDNDDYSKYFPVFLMSRLTLDMIQRSVKFDQTNLHVRDLSF